MKAKYTLFLLPLLLSGSVWAAGDKDYDPYQDIYLKDGTVYHGFISKQTPDNDIYITYHSVTYTRENAIVIPTGDPGDSKVMVKTDNEIFSDVVLLQDGDVAIFRKDLESPLIKLSNMREVEKIVYPVVDGIRDIFTTISGKKYSGHLLEKAPGRSRTILQDNGKKAVLRQSNLVMHQREAKDKSLSITSMSPFLDKYEYLGTTVSGILTSQSFTDDLLIVTDPAGNTLAIKLDNVGDIYTEVMEEFTVVKPQMGDKEIRINDKVREGFEVAMKNSHILIPAKERLPFINVESGKLVLEVNNDVPPYGLFVFNPIPDGDDQIKIDQKKTNDKVTITPDEAQKGRTTTKFVYDDVTSGFYALYNTTTKIIFLLWVN